MKFSIDVDVKFTCMETDVLIKNFKTNLEPMIENAIDRAIPGYIESFRCGINFKPNETRSNNIDLAISGILEELTLHDDDSEILKLSKALKSLISLKK